MEIFYISNFKNINYTIKNVDVVLGFFDGVHLGHQYLINYMSSIKKDLDLTVITFSKAINKDDRILTSIDKKIEIFKKLNVKYLIVFHVTDEFIKMSDKDFINKILFPLNPKSITCGLDFKFGYKGLGDVNTLKSNFSNVNVLNYFYKNNKVKISSSLIKKEIENGEIEIANNDLGRLYSIDGIVVHGLKNGRTIGYPTANIKPNYNYVMPKNGVYITKIKVKANVYESFTNIGIHPTISKLNKEIIETHIFNFDEFIYDEYVEVYFIKRIRDEVKFESINDLKEQLDKDKKDTIDYFLKIN